MTSGSLSSEYPGKHHGFMLGVAISNPCTPSTLDAYVGVAGSVLAKAVSREHRHYREKFHSMYAQACIPCVHRMPRIQRRRALGTRVPVKTQSPGSPCNAVIYSGSRGSWSHLTREGSATEEGIVCEPQGHLSYRASVCLEKEGSSTPGPSGSRDTVATTSTPPAGGAATTASTREEGGGKGGRVREEILGRSLSRHLKGGWKGGGGNSSS